MAGSDEETSAPPPDPPPSRNPLRRLYHWVLSWADHQVGAWALFGISIAESVIFPIPPDPLLLALVIGKRKKAWWYATICTLGSLIGAALGYLIGMMFWGATKDFWLSNIFSESLFNEVGRRYNAWGGLAVFVAAFTPIPFKVFTIAAGVFELNFAVFLVGATIGRAGRFFLVAAITFWAGDRAKPWIEKWFNLLVEHGRREVVQRVRQQDEGHEQRHEEGVEPFLGDTEVRRCVATIGWVGHGCP